MLSSVLLISRHCRHLPFAHILQDRKPKGWIFGLLLLRLYPADKGYRYTATSYGSKVVSFIADSLSDIWIMDISIYSSYSSYSYSPPGCFLVSADVVPGKSASLLLCVTKKGAGTGHCYRHSIVVSIVVRLETSEV